MGQIVLFIFGLLALIKGEFRITRKRKVRGSTGKTLGIIMLVGAVLPLFIPSSEVGVAIIFGTLILVIIIGLTSAEEIEAPKE